MISKKYVAFGWVVLFVCCFAFPAQAKVTFEFSYFDSPGTGFEAPGLGPARKAALESVAAMIGDQLFFHDATVRIGVPPSQTDGTGFLATAGADFEDTPPGVSGIFPGDVISEIQFGAPAMGTPDCGGMPCAGGLVVDFGYSYALDGLPSPTEHHFPSVILHELTHLLGYGSFIASDGSGKNGTFPDVYTIFDTMVTTADGGPLIDSASASPNFSMLDFPTVLASGIEFAGPKTTAVVGDGLTLFPSDPTHSASPSDSMFPFFSPGEVRDSWTRQDAAVLEDLGYEIGSPDYNRNGVVDAADYTVWLESLGATVPLGTGADGSGMFGIPDGFVDERDYLFWKSSFGFVSTGSGLASAVPEPAGLVLLLVGLAALAARRKNVRTL